MNDVSPNSPAAHAGLHNEDYIIEISGVNVETMTYADVVDFIKQKKADDDLQLLVADRGTIQWYKNQRIPISSQLVPKMQYIETLLNEELVNNNNNNNELEMIQQQQQQQHGGYDDDNQSTVSNSECKLL